MKNRILILSGLLWIFAGCVGPNQRPPSTPVAGSPEHIVEKNYIIGEAMHAKPGTIMIRVKDYWIRKFAPGSVVLDRQVTLATKYGVSILPHGRVLRNLGPINIDNIQYHRYVDADDDNGISPICYARPDGSMADFIYVRDKSGQRPGFQKLINKSTISYHFPSLYLTEVMPDGEFSDYTVLFRGKDEKMIYLTCIDSANPDRPEELSFLSSKKNIGYRNLRIELQSSPPEDLAFMVLAD
jgi:hypothetical protein